MYLVYQIWSPAKSEGSQDRKSGLTRDLNDTLEFSTMERPRVKQFVCIGPKGDLDGNILRRCERRES